MNIATFVDATAARHAERLAATDVRSGASLRYGELARESARVAQFLVRQGITAGARIGLLAPNGLAYLPAAFGLLASGACLVPLPGHLTAAEVARVAGDVELNGYLSAAGGDQVPVPREASVLGGGLCDGFRFWWADRYAPGPEGFRALNPAIIRFTSGTTAVSKGVVLSHQAIAARVDAADRVLALTESDRILWVLPLAYHFAVTIVAYVRAGAHVLLCGDTLPHALADAVRRLEPTVLYASPLHFDRLGAIGPTASPEAEGRCARLQSVRLCLSTSAPISATTMNRFERVYGVPVGQAYGIIEAGLAAINTRADGLPAGSVGRAVPGYEIAVVADSGARVPPDVSGEVAVRGGGLFSAYYAPWRPADRVTRDGWFFTGDIGRLDRAGALYLEGRTTAVIFVAGLKFFPEEVEDCINRFAGIRDSRVFGVPHDRLGQVARAEVVGEAVDVDALKAHCARLLSPYKVPLDFRVVPAIPRTAAGKIARWTSA